jgi:hypothetical protein
MIDISAMTSRMWMSPPKWKPTNPMAHPIIKITAIR